MSVEFDFDGFMYDSVLITANAFHQNATEYEIFMGYKRNSNITTNQLRDQLVLYFEANPGIHLFPSNNDLTTTPI